MIVIRGTNFGLWRPYQHYDASAQGTPIEVPMVAGVKYFAEAGPEGCIFVEGHQVLSPTTAKRFLWPRGTFRRCEASREGCYTVADQDDDIDDEDTAEDISGEYQDEVGRSQTGRPWIPSCQLM